MSRTGCGLRPMKLRMSYGKYSTPLESLIASTFFFYKHLTPLESLIASTFSLQIFYSYGVVIASTSFVSINI